MPNENGLAVLKTMDGEFVKEYTIYDGSNRPTDVYRAYTDAPDNAPCYRIQMGYSGGTNLVIKTKESEATWDISWDI